MASIWLLALAVASMTATAVIAQEQKADPAPVRIVKDISYGPHARNLMDIYVPEPAEMPRPMLICIHGGGWTAGDKQHLGWMAEAFARQGFAAVSLTYRFAPEFHAPAQMDDVQRAVRWLRKNAKLYHIDPERFGAIGGSAGAHLAAYLALADTRDNSDPALAEYSSRVQCVVDCYGPVDLAGMMDSASAPIVARFIGQPFAGNEEVYRRASPVSFIRSTPPPFLIVHGTNDIGIRTGQVPIEQSIDFHDRLRNAGGDATLLKLEGAGHGFTGDADSKYAQTTIIAAVKFFTRHLVRPE